MSEILSEQEWEHWFGVLCRAYGSDGLYTAEEKLQLHERALRADRDRWRVTAESDAADLAMAYALGELAAADRDRLEARLAEVRRERDDLEVSLATVAAGFEQARARVARLEAALRKYGHHGPMCDGLPRGWGGAPLGPCDCGLDAALAPASDQLPVPERTTAEPEVEP